MKVAIFAKNPIHTRPLAYGQTLYQSAQYKEAAASPTIKAVPVIAACLLCDNSETSKNPVVNLPINRTPNQKQTR
jgi:hypothetical protein